MSVRKRTANAEFNPHGTTVSGGASTLGLRPMSKICEVHLDRMAIVYVRQSSPQQVIENRESRERQYALAQYAERLGWPAERVLTIDEDQGLSGKAADNRAGFQRLMAEVSMNHVGIVLGLELSRLSRSNKDWHQLVDVCGIFNTLLCDQDGVYDATDGNDRLLLGMKGAMSEFELVTLHNRLTRGTRNKAERGELFLNVPVGYVKQLSGEIIQDPDEQVRSAVQLVFDKFAELGSSYAVFRYFTVNKLRLGFRRMSGPLKGDIEWRPVSPNRVLWLLRHPFYAGAYAFGLHRRGTRNPVTGKFEGGKWFVPPDELPVLIRDKIPPYITWDRFMENQANLKHNRATKGTRGVPKNGAALLSGIIVCRKCGYRMMTRYPGDRKPIYQCNEYYLHSADDLSEFCGRIAAATLDALVEEQVLRALQPASLELSLQSLEQAEQERKRLHDHWRQRLERAQHEVARAERQYHLAEPENRLVARTLESRWEDALRKLRTEQEEYDRFLTKVPAMLSQSDRDQIMALSENVPQLWKSSNTSAADRKQIVRCLVEQVVVSIDRASESNEVTIIWRGGMETSHRVMRAVGSFEHLTNYRQLVERVRDLHRSGLQLKEIAEKLNQEGFNPPRRRGQFTVQNLADFARRLGLFGELFRDDLLKINEWWIHDLAKILQVGACKVHYWVKKNWVHHRRTPTGKHHIVWADHDELCRLRKLAATKNSWLASRHPDLVIPKKRCAK